MARALNVAAATIYLAWLVFGALHLGGTPVAGPAAASGSLPERAAR